MKMMNNMAKNPFIKTPFSSFQEPDKMSRKDAGKEIEQLREAIEHHNYLYYIKNKPAISDHQFDDLFQRLLDLEEHFPAFESDVSPTRKVGAPPVDQLKKKKHAAPMLSLHSSDEEKQVDDFIETVRGKAQGKRTDFVLEPKFDGLSVEVVYENGAFSYGATRGDGETGEDISENVKTINSLPLKLHTNGDYPDFLAVRGEIYMGKDDFQQLNKERIEQHQEPFANARNAAAGIVRQLDSKKVADKPLDIFFYEVLADKETRFDSHWEMLQQLPCWGLKTNPECRKSRKVKEIRDYYHDIGNKREVIPYEIDGIVIKLDDRKLRSELGTRRRSPRWAHAWKFKPKKEITTLREITVQVGRTGVLTPVALLEPVEVGGVTVSRATLHNEEEVRKKDVRPGDQVRVMRAGDVIPEIAERVQTGGEKRGKPFEMPDHCPVCRTQVLREGAHVVCPAGLSCKAQLKGSLIHFASRGAMNIDHLGEKVIGQLVDRGMVRNLPDLYKLKAVDLEELDGLAEKSARKLYEAIQGSKSPDLEKFLYALGIRQMGRHIARIIAKKYRTLDAIRQTDNEELVEIQEIGPEIAESITHFFGNETNLEMLDQMQKLGIHLQEAETGKSGMLKGKTFVLTGELDRYTRKEAKEKVEALGGRATSSVSDQTDYLVVGENPGKKLNEAKKKKVQIIDEKHFRKLINE
jgi:DNA ligase (NAD+)